MIDVKAELRQRLQALYEIALGFLSEEEARDLFCSIAKRRPGKRGPARKLNPHPTKEADRKRRAREPRIEFIRELTDGDLRTYDRVLLDRMDRIIADKK
jgi:hypothetical protein